MSLYASKTSREPAYCGHDWQKRMKTNIVLRRNLLDLALQNANKDEIEKNIKQIEAIEGNEGLLGRYCQVRYLIWQAKRAADKDTREAIQYKARVLLDDLMSRRGDWSVIPLASAELAEQELAQGNLREDQIQAKEERIIGFYLQAINLGQRHAAVVRRAVQLLFKNGRGSSALELLSSIPVESQLGTVKRLGLPLKIETSSTQSKSPERQSRPNPMISRSESGWLKFSWPASVESRPRKNFAMQLIFLRVIPIDGSALVVFMIFTKQPDEAEKIIHEAETKLPPLRAPMALALCCEKMGEMYGKQRQRCRDEKVE